MKKKLFVFVTLIIVASFTFINVFIDQIHNLFSTKITLPANEIISGEVSERRVGGTLRHELSTAEIKEFIDFFNSCNISDKECNKSFGKHTNLSDSTDITLKMKNGTAIYYMAFCDGEIAVTDEYSSKYYSLYNKELHNYILNLGRRFIYSNNRVLELCIAIKHIQLKPLKKCYSLIENLHFLYYKDDVENTPLI